MPAAETGRAVADYTDRLDPKYAIAYSNRGNSYRLKGDLAAAIADLDQAIRLNPKFAIAYNNRGNVYYSKNEYDRAIADFTEASASIRMGQRMPITAAPATARVTMILHRSG